ncbi:MAG: alpha,alpha-trehalose-phosphate synthase (UDP-forming) [Rhodospirillaceae bacterium]|nr:alpha,alpha-trehalose-phosphate synthase (UDP-forming) [Rhodospirillaceae bacterium]
MSRLVVVSNRVALPSLTKRESTGGLAVAVLEALEQHGGIWCGWSGDLISGEPEAIDILEDGKITYATLDLPEDDYEQFYNGYSNGSLWPLLHYRLDLVEYSRQNYAGYMRVNQRFAEHLRPLLQDDDLVWVHDYHFIPLARELRQRRCTQRMGFFLHVPWPSREVLTALPDHRELAEALLEYDVVGFQTKGYVLAFLDFVVRELGGTVEPDGFLYALGKRTRVQHFPISIETENFTELAEEAEGSNHVRRLVQSMGDGKLILGVDRLDYSKGLINRFQAYEHLLREYPEHCRSATLMQIAPTSRGDVLQYQEIRQELETEAGHINGTYADFDWTPIRYLNKGFSRKILAGFYRRSQVGLVTPLRDGMNLVAKEYVAAQSAADPGVLILSRFAGAAEEMDGALLVNSYDLAGMADAMNQALTMPLEERVNRWVRMIDQLQSFDVHHWCRTCLRAIEMVAVSQPNGDSAA